MKLRGKHFKKEEVLEDLNNLASKDISRKYGYYPSQLKKFFTEKELSSYTPSERQRGQAVKVLIVETGDTLNSMVEAAELLGLNWQVLQKDLIKGKDYYVPKLNITLRAK